MFSIVMPAFNEEKNIKALLKELLQFRKTYKEKFELIIIDDGSTDSTGKIIDSFSKKYNFIRSIHFRANRGKGYAIPVGIKKARYNKIILMDGDGQHSVSDIPKLLGMLKKNDFVIGQRNFRKMPIQRRDSNRLSSLALYLAKNVRIKDVLSGFRALRKDAFEDADYETTGYEIEIEMIEKAIDKRLRIGRVGIKTIYSRGSRMPLIKSIQFIFYLAKKVLHSFLRRW